MIANRLSQTLAELSDALQPIDEIGQMLLAYRPNDAVVKRLAAATTLLGVVSKDVDPR